MSDYALLRILAGLLLVIVAILCCAWLARRSGLIQRSPNGILKNIATTTLGPRHQVTIIQVEQIWLVVGVSSQQITLLHTLPARVNDDAPARPWSQRHLADKLARVLKPPQ